VAANIRIVAQREAAWCLVLLMFTRNCESAGIIPSRFSIGAQPSFAAVSRIVFKALRYLFGRGRIESAQTRSGVTSLAVVGSKGIASAHRIILIWTSGRVNSTQRASRSRTSSGVALVWRFMLDGSTYRVFKKRSRFMDGVWLATIHTFDLHFLEDRDLVGWSRVGFRVNCT
jgi:hypothetical protein